MRAAVTAVEDAEGAVGALVNNAGYSQSGAIETLPLDRLRAQFETNVFGLVRLCQLVLPGMRRQGGGRIVNVSSMGGRLTFPGGGAYHGTKHAVEALSDALRFEVRGFGVDVVLIEPGLIKTRFGETAAGSIDAAMADGDDPYSDFNAAVGAATAEVYEGPLARLGGGPETVARAIERAISARRPKTRYKVTPSAHLILAQRRLLSDRAWDAFLRTQFPTPGKRPGGSARNTKYS
jgi:NAD(P)-dependent dehydrogenase (short-subunit alcohol dehydrogenase family)